MSLVLGPVHHWMFKKIKTTEAREAFVVDALKSKYGQEADEILNAIYSEHPLSDRNASLEEILGNVSRHQGIQDLIISAETREAAVIAAFCEKYGDEAKALILKTRVTMVLNVAKELLRREELVVNVPRQRRLSLYKVICVMEGHATGALRHGAKKMIAPRGIILNVFMNSVGKTRARHLRLCAIC